LIIEDSTTNCPELFYCNCTNAGLKCNSCLAGTGKEGFLYNPRDSSYPKRSHPYIKAQQSLEREQEIERKQDIKYIKGKQNRYKGRQTEKQLTTKLSGMKFNPTSIGNDGKVILKDGTEFPVELKTRLTKFSWPTKKEWDKFKQGSLKFFIVKDANSGEHRVCMDLKTLNELIDIINIYISNDHND
jgi:hypothetical protein